MMFLLIYVLDSVSFVLFVYLCIHSTRSMVNKVIQSSARLEAAAEGR